MNGVLKWSNAYNNKKGQQKQRCLYNCMKLLLLLSELLFFVVELLFIVVVSKP